MIEMDRSPKDYSRLDRPEILLFLFYPRREEAWRARVPEQVEEITIPVEGGVYLGARFFSSSLGSPNLLFFHGNGEIVADYDDVGEIYQGMGINFIPVDYRGYGRSTGVPTVNAMMHDCHLVLDFFMKWLAQRGRRGPILVMGRSLGSAPALELAASHPELIDGLVIESGFSRIRPLLDLFGLSMESLGLSEEDGFCNLEKIERFRKDTLIIHGEADELISVEEGRALYEASGASWKRFLRIRGAGHNDLFFRGEKEYLASVREIVKRVCEALNRECPSPS